MSSWTHVGSQVEGMVDPMYTESWKTEDSAVEVEPEENRSSESAGDHMIYWLLLVVIDLAKSQ